VARGGVLGRLDHGGGFPGGCAPRSLRLLAVFQAVEAAVGAGCDGAAPGEDAVGGGVLG
jgi:hypothetical protein